MPVKKAARPKKTARGKKPIGLTSALGPKATTMVVIITIAAGIMIASRQQQARAKERMESARADVVLSAEPDAKTKPSTATPGSKAGEASTPAVTATAGSTKALTMTGCLERSGDGYRLTETAGAEAPKARSWKSGFLKKSTASVDVLDPARTLPLADHVGRRVSVTGTLTDRDLQARSVRSIGACRAN